MLNYALVENALALNPNGYVAIVSSNEIKDLNAVIDYMVSEGTGLTRPQALAYFEKLTQTIEFFVGQGFRVVTPLMRIRPVVRGVFTGPDDFFDPSRHKICIRTATGLRLSETASKIAHNKVEISQPIPIVRVYIDGMNKKVNISAVSDGSGVIKGKWLRFDPEDSRQGVFFVSESDPSIEIPMTGYTEIMPSKVHFRVPALPADDYRIVVKTVSRDGNDILEGKLRYRIHVE